MRSCPVQTSAASPFIGTCQRHLRLCVSRVAVNARARPGGALYERFLDAMAGHVADLGGAFQSLMGSRDQVTAPLTFAFHGTPPPNVPSILENGMLPEKRVAGGDWFGTSPITSLP
ncbi:hypothetical protein KFL_009860010 [Klebsormidium nitens]|uniref:Uncharacterized protein n=1 Tax=Klebsormidium nitens TaxID=105231 RepID=A0A1Y1IST1_KLENI|nr:hypothetical protein KFL_009860010 [Klebsormidium nitens]|eukprot:GAQ92341.1 hypothetical protein KFL_009860010 [Klebsormidium nitens]